MTRNKIEYEISTAPNVGGHGHTSLSLVRIEIMGQQLLLLQSAQQGVQGSMAIPYEIKKEPG